MSNISTDDGKFAISEFVDSFGITRRTWGIVILLAVCMLFDGYGNSIANFCLPSIQAEWGLDSAAAGSVSSWSLIGLVIGAVIVGYLSDRIGRKKTMIISVLCFGIFSLPLYFVNSFAAFAVFRVLSGMGLGACIPMSTTMMSEWAPSKYRGTLITVGMAVLVCGGVISGILGGFFCNPTMAAAVNAGQYPYDSVATIALPLLPGLHADYWRVSFLVGFIPVFHTILLAVFLPESPHYLASKGQLDKVVNLMQDYERRATGSVTKSAGLTPDQIVITAQSQRTRGKRLGPSALISKKYIRGTIAVWVTYFCGCMVVYGINGFLPKLCGALGYNYTIATVNMLIGAVAAICCGMFADAFGRKKAIAIGFFATAVMVSIVAMTGYLDWGQLAFTVAALVLGFASNFGQSSVQPLIPEVYPVEIRGVGTAWCEAGGRFGGVISPIIVGLIIDMGMTQGFSAGHATSLSFLFIAIPAVFAALSAILLVKKDLRGKSIAEADE